MRAGPSDTSPEAQRVLDAAFRAMSPARKWAVLEDSRRLARTLHDAGIRMRNPSATPREIHRSWIGHTLGELATLAGGESEHINAPAEGLGAVRDVAAALDALEIRWALVGSLASCIHGAPRFTLDADTMAEPFPGKVDAFVARFGPEYYVSPAAVAQAIRDRSTFNVINTTIGFKVDVFIEKGREFDRSILRRRVPSPLLPPPGPPIAVVSPEDILLLTLEWYRLGGESSDRQWSDLLGVLRVRGRELDVAYLERWAAALGVGDLLAEARAEAAA